MQFFGAARQNDDNKRKLVPSRYLLDCNGATQKSRRNCCDGWHDWQEALKLIEVSEYA